MNKRFYVASAALLTFMLILSSCGSQEDIQTPIVVPVTTVTTGDIVTEQTTEPENMTIPETTEDNNAQTAEAVQQEPFDGKFKPGTWFSYNKDESRYYFFNDDKTNGVRLSVKNGVGSAFMYEMDAGTESTQKPAVFHIDTTNNITNAQVTVTDPDHITIVWDDKSEDKLTYLSDKDMNDFMFFTDEELSNMGINYYIKNISGKDNNKNASDCRTNEDGSVTIRVYKTSNDGQQTVLAWYIVDRLSASGEQSDDGLAGNGTAIDLK